MHYAAFYQCFHGDLYAVNHNHKKVIGGINSLILILRMIKLKMKEARILWQLRSMGRLPTKLVEWISFIL